MQGEERRVGSLERILHLKKVPTIGTLPAQELAALAEPARERFFPKGSLLLREGEAVPAVYLIVEGQVRMKRKGRDLGIASSGAGVGALGILARDEIGVEAVAEVDTLTLELEADALLEVLEDHFLVLRHLIRDLARQLIELVREMPAPIPDPPAALVPLAHRDLDLVERIFVLRQVAPFARASINALAELARGMTELHFGPGVTLWEEGEPAQRIHLLIDGRVSCVSQGGHRFRLGPGAPMGALETVADMPRWYGAVTDTPVVTLGGDADGLMDVFEDNFEMALDYLAVISRWLMEMIERRAQPGDPAFGPFYEKTGA